MTPHPGYPPDYLDVFQCRELGRCWWCQTRPALKREFCDIPCCSKCKREMMAEAT